MEVLQTFETSDTQFDTVPIAVFRDPSQDNTASEFPVFYDGSFEHTLF